jgi:hypothetical protein
MGRIEEKGNTVEIDSASLREIVKKKYGGNKLRFAP